MRLSDCSGSVWPAQRDEAGLRVRVARIELEHAQITRLRALETLGAGVDRREPEQRIAVARVRPEGALVRFPRAREVARLERSPRVLDDRIDAQAAGSDLHR